MRFSANLLFSGTHHTTPSSLAALYDPLHVAAGLTAILGLLYLPRTPGPGHPRSPGPDPPRPTPGSDPPPADPPAPRAGPPPGRTPRAGPPGPLGPQNWSILDPRDPKMTKKWSFLRSRFPGLSPAPPPSPLGPPQNDQNWSFLTPFLTPFGTLRTPKSRVLTPWAPKWANTPIS